MRYTVLSVVMAMLQVTPVVVLLILTDVGVIVGFEVVDTPQGKMLVAPRQQAEKMATGPEDGSGPRDPFNWAPALVAQRAVTAEEKENSVFASLALSGILWDDRSPLAIIDDTLVQEGDVIQGAVVRAIYRDEVLLEMDNEYYNLRFSELFDLESPLQEQPSAGSK